MGGCWEDQQNLGMIQFFLAELTFEEYAGTTAVLLGRDGLEERATES